MVIALTYRDISLRLSKTKRAILGIYLEDSGLAWPGEGGGGRAFLSDGLMEIRC